MITLEQEAYIIKKAYVPEHIVSLMAGISGGEPYKVEDYVFFARGDWLIFVGYPLEHDFRPKNFAAILESTVQNFRPLYTWFIAPAVPDSFLHDVRERESDEYYKLVIPHFEMNKNLIRVIERAARDLTVEKTHFLSEEHVALIREFLDREEPAPRVGELFRRMPEYVLSSPTSLVLNARDLQKKLSAFYVIELAAEQFAAYVVGCYSRKNYAAHASDLLFFEMVKVAKEHRKSYIHLGLGVNDGIRRFKGKWGGIPFLKYESCELSTKPRGPFSWIRALESKL